MKPNARNNPEPAIRYTLNLTLVLGFLYALLSRIKIGVRAKWKPKKLMLYASLR